MKNYIRSAFALTVMVCLMLFGLRYIPDTIVTSAGLKPIDIIADLNSGNTIDELDQLDAETGANTDQREGEITHQEIKPPKIVNSDTVRVANGVVVVEPIDSLPTFLVPPVPLADSLPAKPEEPLQVPQDGITPVVDYSKDGAMLNVLTTRLTNVRGMSRPIRIGFMGDSFIEGDILTNDFREMMQTKYGGGGVGFVPITSPVAGFRQTVRHKFDDWESSSIIRDKNEKFTISAFNYTPEENSTVEYKGSNNKKHLSSFTQARMLFISHGRSVIRATINGNLEYIFNTEPEEELQEFIIDDVNIKSIKYTMTDVEGLMIYGAFLDDNTGVCVDNFAVRSSSGTLMSRVDLGLTRQFRQLVPYDLIVLQYGLNMASDGVTQYSNYKKQMSMVVNHIKHCFPNAAIMVMSIGDRATNASGETMKGITAMEQTQKEVAQDCGVLFWSTYDAMIADGGIGQFVKNGWAAKDYTHLSSRGGKKVATALYEAVTTAAGE